MPAEITKTDRIIHLIILLQSPGWYSITDLTERLGRSDRTVFRDFQYLARVGVQVQCNDGRYRITKNNLSGILGNDFPGSRNGKGDALYKLSETEKKLKIVSQLASAIGEKKMIRLFDYRSAKGISFPKTLEPFLLSANDQALWAWDTATSSCKQFKVVRMGSVEILNKEWQSAHRHQLPFTDIFNLSAAEAIDTIQLRLSDTSYNLLIEEYPKCLQFQNKKNPKLFTIPVADYRGAGRFVLGLMDAITVVSSDAFKAYLRITVKKFGKY